MLCLGNLSNICLAVINSEAETNIVRAQNLGSNVKMDPKDGVGVIS